MYGRVGVHCPIVSRQIPASCRAEFGQQQAGKLRASTLVSQPLHSAFKIELNYQPKHPAAGMEPVSALGAASSIITFIDFAVKLISTSKELHQSCSGISIDNLRAEEICQELSALCAQFEKPASWASSPSDPPDAAMLKRLCTRCKEDCDQLLDLLLGFRIEGQHRLWSSVKAAFKSSIGQQKIDIIQKRLDRTQSNMIVYLSTFLHNRILELSSGLHGLTTQSKKLQSDQTSAIKSVTQSLAALTVETKRVQQQVSATCTKNTDLLASQFQPLIAKLSEVAGIERKLSGEQAILTSLDFEGRAARREHIPEAYAETFGWALCSSNLATWLESSDSERRVFWVSGKAGSGKSTLMKFLTSHPTTAELLQRWSGSRGISIVEHYFWSSGNSMQKSYLGLIQSLLYGILSKVPSLIPKACPDRWAQLAMTSASPTSDPWTTVEISQAFLAVTENSDIPVKFCYFIDGLDDFEGDSRELCQLVQNLAISSGVKICISSRPWVLFEDTFGGDASTKLYVHELTAPDIRRYCRGRLKSHSQGPDLQDENSSLGGQAREDLIEEIVNKAEGVFRWVFLATQSLRSGLENGDTVEELQERLRILPDDLKNLFKSILDTVDPVYHQKMAGFLQLAVHANVPLRAELYWQYEKEFSNPDYVRCCPIEITSPETMAKIRFRVSRLVNVRTKGLLEARGSCVEFLHRTVRDFLLTQEMADYLGARMKPGQNTLCSLVKANVASIKSTTLDRVVISKNGQGRLSGPFIYDIRNSMQYALRVSEPFTETVADLMNELEGAVHTILSSPNFHHLTTALDPGLPFREELIQYGPASYLREKLEAIPSYLDNLRQQPLLTVMGLHPPCLGKLRVLLKHSQSPNGTNHFAVSPWLIFMEHLRKAGIHRLREVLLTDMIPLFLSHGANPDARMSLLGDTQTTTFAWYLSLCAQDYLSESDDYIQFQCDYLRSLDAFLNTDLTQERKFGIVSFCSAVGSMPVSGRRKTWLLYAVMSRLVQYWSTSSNNSDNSSVGSALAEAATANFATAQVQRLFRSPGLVDNCAGTGALGKRKPEEHLEAESAAKRIPEGL